MNKYLSDNVMCCFCGESLLLKDAAILTVQSSVSNEENQQLFCHKNHLLEKLHPSVVLHPDFFEPDEK